MKNTGLDLTKEKTELGALVNYGFNEEDVVIEQEAYILGSTSKLPNIVYREDGQWPEVTYEPQASKYETSGCTVWGSENQIEMFTKAVYGVEPNYDERFTYLNAKVTLKGANPQDVYESIRHDGLIDNEPLPDTYDEFSDRAYLTQQRIKSGQEWKDQKFELYHHWLDSTSKEAIVEELKYSPIGLSVTAWYQDKDGLYESRGQMNTHWCVCFGYLKEWEGKPGIYLKIFDSYDHSVKILHPDHRIAYAKRIFLRKREQGDNEVIQGTFYSLWVNGLLSFFADFIQSFKKQKEVKEIPPEVKVTEPPLTTPKPQSKLDNWCDAIEFFESGGDKNAASYRRMNPGNIKGPNGNFLTFPTYEAGRAYLMDYLTRAATNRHDAFVRRAAQLGKNSSGLLTVREFIEVYTYGDSAEIQKNYALCISRYCDATPETFIRDLL